MASCSAISESNLTECEFVLNTSSCQPDSGFINYNTFVYCDMSTLIALAIILLILWLLVLLCTLATTADSFFGPCLIVVTHVSRMSENLAGVTLLAFGNGAADIFSSISAVNNMAEGDAGLAFGALMGAGILVNTVTAGLIMIVKPFGCMRRPIMKDVIFYLIAVLWTLSILLKGYIHLAESIGFIGLYFVYVIITVVGRMLFSKPSTKEIIDVPMSTLPDGTDNPAYQTDPNDKPAKSSRFRQLDLSLSGDIEPEPAFPNRIPSKKYGRRGSKASQHSSGGNSPTVRRRAISTSRGYMARWIMAENEAVDLKKIVQESRRRTVSDAIEVEAPPPRRPSIAPSPSEIRKRAQTTNVDARFSGSEHPRLFAPSPQANKQMRGLGDFPKMERILSIDAGQAGDQNNQMPNWEKDPETDLDHSEEEKNKDKTTTEEEEEDFKFPGQWKWLLITLQPIHAEDWAEMSWPSRIYEILRSPLVLLLRLFIPVVDEEAALNGWCRPLNCFHCVSALVFISLATQFGQILLGGVFPIAILIMILGVILGLVVWFTSKPETPPIYHPVFAFVGFLESIVWIYSIANEIVNILGTFGLVFNLSQAILGLTLLAYANSVGDMISNLVLAKSNFPRIAFSACVGGPLFNILLGIGIPFTIKIAGSSQAYTTVNITLVQVVLISTLIVIMVMDIIFLPVQHFRLRPLYGGCLIAVYFIFLIIALLSETGVIPSPYPTK